MSVDAIRWAYTQTAGSAAAKAVLIAIADHADDDMICFPSIPLIVRKTEMTRNTVRRGIDLLLERGLIQIVSHGRQHHSTHYRIMVSSEFLEGLRRRGSRMAPLTRNVSAEEIQDEEPRGCIVDTQRVHDDPLTIKEPPKEEITPSIPQGGGETEKKTRKRDEGYSDDFIAFWDMYPRKINKPFAYRAWKAAVGRKKVFPAQIFTCLEQDLYDAWKGRDVQYIPHPATWLNGDPWDRGTDFAKPEPKPTPAPQPAPHTRDLFGA